MSTLETLADQFHPVYTAIQAEITKEQDFLTSLNIPVSAWVSLHPRHATGPSIGWLNHQNYWQLVVQYSGGDIASLFLAPVHLQQKAPSAFPRLREALCVKLKNIITNTAIDDRPPPTPTPSKIY